MKPPPNQDLEAPNWVESESSSNWFPKSRLPPALCLLQPNDNSYLNLFVLNITRERYV